MNLYIDRKKDNPVIFNAALALMLYIGLGGVFLSFLKLEYNRFILIFIGLVVIVISSLFIDNQLKTFLGLGIVLAFSILCWIIFNKYAGNGLKIFVNAFTRLASIRDRTILGFYEINLPQGSQSLALTIFLFPCVILFAYLIFISAKYTAVFVPIGATVLVLAFMKIYDIDSISPLICLLFISIYLMIIKKYFNYRDLSGTFLPIIIVLIIFNAAALPFLGTIRNIFYTAKLKNLDENHSENYESMALPLPEGRLDKIYSFDGDIDAIAFALNNTVNETTYFRGFIGERFSNKRWNSLSGEELFDQQKLIYNLHTNGFYPQSQTAQLSKLLNLEKEMNEYSIILDNACKAFNYNSYGFYSSKDNLLNAFRMDDSSLEVLPSYSYFASNFNEDDFINLYNNLSYTSDNEELKTYLENEKNYRSFVYGHYLELDKALEGSFGSVEKNKNYETVINRFRETIKKANLTTSYEKASFAANALRYYGIPTRYVEGYVVPAGRDYAKLKNAHAWVEYYIDGVGWALFDTNPGEIEQIEKETPKPLDIPKPNQNPQPKPQKEKEDNKEENQNIYLFVYPIVFIISAIVLFFTARYVVLNKRNEKYYSSDYKLSINYAYNRLLFLLNAMKFDIKSSDLYTVSSQINSVLGEDFASKYNEFTALAYRGIFDNKDLTKEERDYCLFILKKFYDYARTTKQNLLYKYILWVY